MVLNSTNEILFELFKNEDCTQIEFSFKSGFDKQSIHDWLKNKNEMKFSKLEEVAKNLNKQVKIMILNKTTTEDLVNLSLQINEELNKRLNICIKDVEMTPRLHNSLFNAGIERLNQINDSLKVDLLLNDNRFTMKELKELETILKNYKL